MSSYAVSIAIPRSRSLKQRVGAALGRARNALLGVKGHRRTAKKVAAQLAAVLFFAFIQDVMSMFIGRAASLIVFALSLILFTISVHMAVFYLEIKKRRDSERQPRSIS